MTIAKINQLLQSNVNEIFFAPVIVLVEGLEDAAYLSSYLLLTDCLHNFRRLGCHIVPAHGKDRMVELCAIMKQLTIPFFVIYDSDSGDAKHATMHEADNRAILTIMNYAGEMALPNATLWKDDLIMWHEDIGKVLDADVGTAKWTGYQESAKNKYKLHGNGSLKKNSMLISYALAEAIDAKETLPTLKKWVDAVAQFAQAATGKAAPQLAGALS